MLTFTTPTTVPNITRCRLRRPIIDDDTNEMIIACDVQGPAGVPYNTFVILVRNNGSVGIQANAAAVKYDDRIAEKPTSTPTGFTTARAAFMATGTPAQQIRALETHLVSLGLLPAGTVA